MPSEDQPSAGRGPAAGRGAPSRLAVSASRGAVATLTGQGLRVLVQTAGVVVLARLLAPADYGLVAEVLAIIGLGEVFRDFGLTSAAVQAKSLSRDQWTNLFWLNSGIGALLTAAAFLGAPLAALLYHEHRLVGLTEVLAVTFLLNGASTQFRADLNRALRFGKLASIEVIGQIAGLVLGVAMALTGAGYWALAGQQVAQAMTTLVLLWVSASFRPGRYVRTEPMGSFLRFGLDVVLAQLLGYASKNTDTVVIGSAFGPAALGLYNRAFQLLTLPLAQINAPSTRVALPVLAQLHDDPVRFKRFLLAGQSMMLHVALAVFSWSGALAVPLIAILLGPKWAPSAHLFQILAVAGVFSTAGYSTYWVFLAKGLTRQQLWWQVLSRPVFVVTVLLGALQGVNGVATAYASASAAMWLFGLLWIRHVSDAPAWAMLLNGSRAISGYALPTAGAVLALNLPFARDPLSAIVTASAAWAIGLLIVSAAWPAFRHDLLGLLRLPGLMRARRIVTQPAAAPVPSSR